MADQIDDLCVAPVADGDDSTKPEGPVSRGEAGLVIGGLDAGRFVVRVPAGALAVNEAQYVIVEETEVWTLNSAVDATTWSEYESTFATAAESFRISGAVP